MKEELWVDEFSEAWAREYPETDTSGMLLIARLVRLTVLVAGFERETLLPFDLTPSDYAVLAALRRVGPPCKLVRLTAAGKRVEEQVFEAFLARAHEMLHGSSDLEMINESVQRLTTIIEAGSNP